MNRLSKTFASGSRRATALAVALFVFGFGEELWFRYLDVGSDDTDTLNRAEFLYDSLYAHLRRQNGSRA